MKFCPRCGTLLDFAESDAIKFNGVLYLKCEGTCENGHGWDIEIVSSSPDRSKVTMVER